MTPPRPKFTVRRLMVVVGLIGLGLAVVRFAARRWGMDGIMALVMTALLAPTALVHFRRFRRQVFWVWFGAFGGLYLSLSFFPPLGVRLPTERLVDTLHDRLPAELTGPSDAFRKACQVLLCLAFGSLAGWFGRAVVPIRALEGLSADEERPTFGAYFPTVVALWSRVRSR